MRDKKVESIQKITIEELVQMKDREGLVLQGCGGDPKEWLDGINRMLAEEGILLSGKLNDAPSVRLFHADFSQ